MLKSKSNFSSPAKLKDLIDKIDWIVLQSAKAGHVGLALDQLGITLRRHAKTTEPGKADQVSVRIGKSLRESLGWEAGDRIVVMHNPDHLLHFLLAKSENGGGRVLSQESNSHTSRLQFKWDNSIVPLRETSLRITEYEIHQGYISFIVTGE